MLILVTKKGQDVFITDNEGNELVRIIVGDVNYNKVDLQFDFKETVKVWRGDLHRRIKTEKAVLSLKQEIANV